MQTGVADGLAPGGGIVVAGVFFFLSLLLMIRFRGGPGMRERHMRAQPAHVEVQVKLGFALLPIAVFWLAMVGLFLSSEAKDATGWQGFVIMALACFVIMLGSSMMAAKEFCARSRLRRVPGWVRRWESEREQRPLQRQ